MKKRAMKKWIPKGLHCHSGRGCKWRKHVKTIVLNKDNCDNATNCELTCWETPESSCRIVVYRCEYMGYTDIKQESLLWDACKECGEKYDI